MHKKLYCLSLVTVWALAIFTGCQKSNQETKALAISLQSPDPELTLARLHWLGKKRIAAESSATNFMAIWNLPESAKLEAQTLDKLATAPWRFLSSTPFSSKAPTALLRPLLDDLVQEEAYLEVRGATNQPNAFALAIRLDAIRAALWRTNLPVILASLGREARPPAPVVADSDLRLQTSDFSFALSRSGEWTLLSLTKIKLQTPDFGLLEEFRSRIQRAQAPFAARTTNYWLETDLDLRALGLQTSLSTLENLPRLSLAVFGDGPDVRTRGELNFPAPLPIELEAWHIPTNLVHDPLIGFMAIRGIRPWLAAGKFWLEQQLGTPPNQAFFWVQDGLPAFHFFAVPSSEGSNQLRVVSELLLKKVNPLIALFPNTTNAPMGAFEQVPDSSLLRWRGLPYIAPNLDLATVGGSPFIAGGLFRNTLTNRPAPPELFQQFQSDTNLVFYDWETTQPCEFGLIQMFQAGRLVFGRARLSLTNNAALPWLVAISPKLGNAGTSLRRVNANRLTFSRTSTLGLTGLEISLLADWLESPTFPKGFFTLEAAPTPFPSVPAPLPAAKP